MSDLSLGDLIRKGMLNKNLTIRKLSFAIGVGSGNLSNIEKEINLPQIEFFDDYVSQVQSSNSLRTMHILMKISDELELDKNALLAKAGMLPVNLIHGFLEFPEEINNAEKYFAEKFAYRKTPEGQAKMRNNPT